ncbi:MAG TPA: hypothetical protein PLO24_08455 [Bacteroidales bacterium]|jgi:hypothetical protein|nr:hypothetical protein [Bacteroidales bacterium]HOS71433.1 hypothetical protein [Bacteroidales bacterium]HQH24915.1 hypothetical protein [Bacteroidales bacterium]HQJ82319.1 hypothetical protein [Bacteroidales bacterium]
MTIDIRFNVYSDAKSGDPDSTSPTLRSYHKLLWSKQLPNGEYFELTDKKRGAYLFHKSRLGEYYLGSDAITHSYRNHKRKIWLTRQIPNEVEELFDTGSTIGAYTLFPNKRVDGKHTINQARGVNSFIDDRFDLTLECIRLFYIGQQNPLYDTFLRYKDFFDLFENFNGYINFFLLNDLIDDNGKIQFYLPFDNFKTKPAFADVGEYLIYKKGVMDFVKARNKRINKYANS